MVDQIKIIDCHIMCLKPKGISAKEALELEKAQGRGGAYTLFPGVAERNEKGATHEELVAMMDKFGIEKALISVHNEEEKEWVVELKRKYPGKFTSRYTINPVKNGIMNEIRLVKSLIREMGMQVIGINGGATGMCCTDNILFPFYSLAIEYDLKVDIACGYPGPAGLARFQNPVYVDEVCNLLPELKVIQTHLGHPWVEEVMHNAIKYPNCYVKTQEYRPKYFPPAFIQHANTRAQDKVIWGSGYPTIPFETSLGDVKNLPLRDHVRPKYLRENALRLFKFE